MIDVDDWTVEAAPAEALDGLAAAGKARLRLSHHPMVQRGYWPTLTWAGASTVRLPSGDASNVNIFGAFGFVSPTFEVPVAAPPVPPPRIYEIAFFGLSTFSPFFAFPAFAGLPWPGVQGVPCDFYVRAESTGDPAPYRFAISWTWRERCRARSL